MTFIPYQDLVGQYDDISWNALRDLFYHSSLLFSKKTLASLINPDKYLCDLPTNTLAYVGEKLATFFSRSLRTSIHNANWWITAEQVYESIWELFFNEQFKNDYRVACEKAIKNKTGVVVIEGTRTIPFMMYETTCFSVLYDTLPIMECHEWTDYLGYYLNSDLFN